MPAAGGVRAAWPFVARTLIPVRPDAVRRWAVRLRLVPATSSLVRSWITRVPRLLRRTSPGNPAGGTCPAGPGCGATANVPQLWDIWLPGSPRGCERAFPAFALLFVQDPGPIFPYKSMRTLSTTHGACTRAADMLLQIGGGLRAARGLLRKTLQGRAGHPASARPRWCGWKSQRAHAGVDPPCRRTTTVPAEGMPDGDARTEPPAIFTRAHVGPLRFSHCPVGRRRWEQLDGRSRP